MSERWTVYALAPPRAEWFTAISHWATSGALAVDVTKCLSPDELRARLAARRAVSAVVIDGTTPGLDRDLIDRAGVDGTAVLVVDGRRPAADWHAVGVHAVLAPPLTAPVLAAALREHALVIAGPAALPPEERPAARGWLGPITAVCGPGGTGASTVAMAVAQGLAADIGSGQLVLADFALRADQAMLHDAGDVVPGVQELVEAHRLATVSESDIRQLTHRVERGGYDLLLGLRRARDWSTLRPLAVEAATSGLRRAYRAVVVDTEADVEGEADGGSIDVEERHLLARTAIGQATVVLVVGLPGLKGLHALSRTIAELCDFGVATERIVPVVNRAGRSARQRSEHTSTLARLLGGERSVATPVYLPERPVEAALRTGDGVPAPLPQVLASAVAAVAGAVETGQSGARRGARVEAGSIGAWSSSEEAAG